MVSSEAYRILLKKQTTYPFFTWEMRNISAWKCNKEVEEFVLKLRVGFFEFLKKCSEV